MESNLNNPLYQFLLALSGVLAMCAVGVLFAWTVYYKILGYH